MSGTTLDSAYPNGVSLTNAATQNPLTIASTASVSDSNKTALYGVASVYWDITNFGSVTATGTSSTAIGVALAGGGAITNAASADISGYAAGVFLTAAGTLANSGSIVATATAAQTGIGVRLPSGGVTNLLGGSISANNWAVEVRSDASIDNAGQINATGATYSYGLRIFETGTATNESTGSVVSTHVGIGVLGVGSVTNYGSIASTQAHTGAGLNGSAGVALLAGGTVTNESGAQIDSQWIGVQIGQPGTSVTGSVTNYGTIFASNGSNAGAAVWMHGTGVVLNGTNAVIAGGPYGIVTYYDTTVINDGSIGGGEFAISQANTAASNLVEVAPGAAFAGLVEGGAPAADAATGTLELLAGSGAGSLTDFGTQFIDFGVVAIEAGATWSLAGTVSITQSLLFAGAAGLTLVNPIAMAGTIDGFVSGDSLVLSGITGVTSAVVNASDQLVVSTSAGPAVTLQLDPARHDPVGTAFAATAQGDATALIACFAAGTRIATEHGEIPVQALAEGMRVRARFGGLVPICWLGHRRTECRRHPRPHDVWPVRIAAGAFGAGVPARDLWLSPDHAVFVAGVLVPVRHLIDGDGIAQEAVDTVEYWHVEVPRHDVLLAEGLPCESFLDTGNRAAFANAGGATMLHPAFAARSWDGAACARLVATGAELERVRAARRRATPPPPPSRRPSRC